jgi:hypothetical protein
VEMSGDGHIDGSGFRGAGFQVRFRVPGSVLGSRFWVRPSSRFA